MTQAMEKQIANGLGRVLIVGGGRMGQAIASSILRLDGFDKDALVIANPGKDKRERIESELGVRTVASAAEGMPARCIILAVKPGKVEEAVSSLVSFGLDPGNLIVSVAAGVTTSKLDTYVAGICPVVRVMPNTPLVCGQGMSVVSPGSSATPEDVELVVSLFDTMGRSIVIDEGQQDVACAVSGSGPAYFELFARCIVDAAEDLGMSRDDAMTLVLQTMLGTASMLMGSGQDLDDAIDDVSSPGGTTVAALGAMERHGVEKAIKSGVDAACARSKELGS